MPEIKHNFTGGKMNKDLDERIVPNGEYRHAVNVQVGTSDDSDVGVIQNILGNKEININHTLLDNDLNYSHLGGNYEFCSATTIGSIAHTSDDAVYFFNKNSDWIQSGEDINVLNNNNDGSFTPGVSENFYIFGDLGLAEYADGSGAAYVVNTTWSSFRPISSSILQYKDNTISPVVISQSVIFKMWDTVIAKSHYDLAASQITTDGYSGSNGNHVVGGTHSNLINNYSYPDLTASGPNFINYGTVGSEGFNYGWGIEGEITHNNVTYGPYKNGNKIEISDARGIKVGMSVKGWGPNPNPQSSGEVINLFPEDLKVTAINNVSWTHNGVLIDGAPGEPQLAQITLSHNIYDSVDNNKLVTHIEFRENTLGFQDVEHITGINIIGNEIFFTDNNSEPKSINIEDGLIGSSDNNGTPIVSQATKLVVDKIKTNIELEEKHLAIIKPAPLHAPKIDLIPAYEEEDAYSRFSIYGGGQTLIEDPNNPGQLLQVSIDQVVSGDPTPDPYQLNALITLSFYLPQGYASYSTGTILHASPQQVSPYGTDITNPDFVFEVVRNLGNNGNHVVKIIKLNGPINQTAIYSVAVQKAEPILEETIGRFCLRYIYKDKQYSPLGPWSDPAFLPTQYNTEEGETVNTGMYNTIRRINLKSLVPPSIREDIVGLDILYKDSSSPSVFKVDTIYKDNVPQSNWNTYELKNFKYLRPHVNGQGDLSLVGLALTISSNGWKGQYSITSKIKKSIIPEIQTLRPWDNVPKKALAQEIVGNRLIYGNYTQGYDVVDQNGSKITLDLTASLQNYKNIIHKENYPYKSIKSFRDYQVGIVFSDFYGRSTPVLTTAESNFHLDMKKASEFNELNVTLNSSIPSWVDSYRFYIKGGEEEYYNLIQKAVYLSSEKDTWISFDSKDRNKLTEEDTITLKVGGITNYDIGRINSYKVLSISNEIPESIKYFKVRRYYEEGRENKAASVLRPDYIEVGKPTIDFRSRQAQTNRNNDTRDGVNPFLNSTHVRISIKEDADKNPIRFSFLEVEGIHAKGANSGNQHDLGARWEIVLKDPVPEEYQAVVGEIEGNPENIIFELYEEKQVDNIQFEGRFFVKIAADKDFAVAYGGTTSVDQYAVAETIEVFYYKDSLITADDSKYEDPPFTNTTIASVTSVERPYVDSQERWGQFLINPLGYSRGRQEVSSTIQQGYTMDGGALPLNEDDVILGFNNPSPTAGLESVGRSLGHPTAGTWFLDDGDYVGSIIDPDSPVRHTERTFQTTGDGGASFLYHPDAGWNYTNINPDSGTNTAYDSQNKVITLSLGGCQAPYLSEQFGGDASVKRKLLPKPGNWTRSWFESTMLNGEFAPGPVGDTGLFRKGTSTPSFISKINPGSRLRWKEDPTGTIYNIKNVGYRALLNYAVNDKHGSIVQSSGTRFGAFPAYFRYPHNFRHSWTIELDQTIDNWNPINATPNSALTNGNVVSVTIGSAVHADPADASVPVNTSTFFLADAGEDANKLHPGMVLTHYHPSGGSNAAVSNNARIHSIRPSIATSSAPVKADGGKAVVHIVNDQQNTSIHSYADGDVLTFKQHSMDGSSKNMAQRRNRLIPTREGVLFSGTSLDNDYNHDLTPVPISYNLEILNATTSVVQQLSGSLSSHVYSVWETSPKNIPDVELFTEINDVNYPETSSFNLQDIIEPGSRVYLATEFQTSANIINNTSTLDNNYTGNVGCQVFSNRLNECVKYGYDSEILNYDEFDLSLISVSNPNGDLIDIFDSNNVSIVSISRDSINLSENFITNSSNTDIRLTSNFPYNGGHTIVHRVIGNTIELANANNSQTNASDGQLKLQVKNTESINSGPDILRVVYEDKTLFLEVVENVENSNIVKVKISNQNYKHKLNYFNCYSFGNGIESVSVGDEFNKQKLLNNGRISTTIDWDFIEEEIHNGLIYSGIYNPASGLNNLNQFIQADKITKEVNPVYGSIQRLFTRNSDLITFCEDKVLKILANKDALFNADGNVNLTASRNVLGQAIPFAGDYGISKNPQSLASESYRLYFADEKRRKVLRLSMDGLSPISDYGMNDWFRDNLENAISIEGSFDENKDEYNLTIIKDTEQNSHTISYSEKVKGWVSFKSFIPEKGISLGRDYFTFKTGKLYLHHQKRDLSTPDFLPIVEYNSIDQSYITDYNYNNFYGNYAESEVDVILNDGPSVVKSFLSLSYEGTDAKVDKFIEESVLSETHSVPTVFSDNDYYNIQIKKGWYVDIIQTDKEKGSLNEFIEKEGKWFNYIKGVDILEQINEFGQFTNPDNI